LESADEEGGGPGTFLMRLKWRISCFCTCFPLSDPDSELISRLSISAYTK
jgi:hypothetical protein